MSQETPITKDGYAQVQEELDHLIKVEREELKTVISEARELGDLKENAEYHSAKEKQSFIEARIKLLNDVLSSSTVFSPATAGVTDRCLFGCYVDVKNDSGETQTYRLVSEYEVDVNHNMISSVSPIGKALMGKETGEEISVNTPEGEKKLTILAVRYQ